VCHWAKLFYPTSHSTLIMLHLHRLEALTCGTELIKCPSCPYFFFLHVVQVAMARAPSAPPPPPSGCSMAHGGTSTCVAELVAAAYVRRHSPAAACARWRSSPATVGAQRHWPTPACAHATPSLSLSYFL
jgi:hypothetical protein